MLFMLGTHKTCHLTYGCGSDPVPLFVSARTLRSRAGDVSPVCDWALDSGGFTELSMHGRWTVGVEQYVQEVRRYQSWGRLLWAAPQDWMCEDEILQRTGLTVLEHQERTVANFVELDATGLPFIPVLQGQTPEDYLQCVELYASAGIDLRDRPLVGVGSVCRRQASTEILDVLQAIHSAGVNRLHGFGVKKTGLELAAGLLTSADSLSWSTHARYHTEKRCWWCRARRRVGSSVPGSCANCLEFGRQWRDDLLTSLGLLDVRHYQVAV